MLHLLLLLLLLPVLRVHMGLSEVDCVGARFAICIAVVFLAWDVRPIFNLVWGTPPLRWLMEYVDPRHPGNDPLHGDSSTMPARAPCPAPSAPSISHRLLPTSSS